MQPRSRRVCSFKAAARSLACCSTFIIRTNVPHRRMTSEGGLRRKKGVSEGGLFYGTTAQSFIGAPQSAALHGIGKSRSSHSHQ